jgi:hypothetical protein
MKKRYLPVFLLLAPLLGCPAVAQDFGNYQPLQSSGQMPADFLQLSSEKYELDKSSIGRKEKAFDKRANGSSTLKTASGCGNCSTAAKYCSTTQWAYT